MRGLKLGLTTYETVSVVASFTDAWIETIMARVAKALALVASFTDAWIETKMKAFLSQYIKSHLLQMRGLKPRTML